MPCQRLYVEWGGGTRRLIWAQSKSRCCVDSIENVGFGACLWMAIKRFDAYENAGEVVEVKCRRGRGRGEGGVIDIKTVNCKKTSV